MTVDFKTPEGRTIIEKLVEKSDVLVENFISGKLASLGLGWEDCQKINERLIYTSISGKDRVFLFGGLRQVIHLINQDTGKRARTGKPLAMTWSLRVKLG